MHHRRQLRDLHIFQFLEWGYRVPHFSVFAKFGQQFLASIKIVLTINKCQINS